MEKSRPQTDYAALGDVFELTYDGPDVQSGSMNARDLVEAIAGINRTFSTTVAEHEFEDSYELRVRDIAHESFHIVFEALALARQDPQLAGLMGAAAVATASAVRNAMPPLPSVREVVEDIGAMISAKRRLRGRRVATVPATFSEGAVRLSPPEEEIVLTRAQYELLLSRRVDRGIAQVISPLSPQKLDLFEMRSGDRLLVDVPVADKSYFSYLEPVEEESREAEEIIGIFNSLSKTSLRGTFHTLDGVHVPYRYSGGDLAKILRGFSAREPVRVFGKIRFGSDGIPISIDVRDLEFLQQTFRDIA